MVHQAPAFGEVDYDVLLGRAGTVRRGRRARADLLASPPTASSPPRRPTTRAAGSRRPTATSSANCSADGLLFHQEQYLHDYPFCWRAEEDPLIQYPRKSWFIRTTQFKDQMLANNAEINWLPEHIRDGRFGNFLETNVDGPCRASATGARRCRSGSAKKTGYMEAVASYDELLAKPGVEGTEVWEEAKTGQPRPARRPEGPQALHRRDHLRLAQGPGRADAARHRGDRLLVRLRRDAVRPVGLSAPGGLRRAIRVAVSGRLHQRGPRPDPRLVLQPAGDQHAVVWRRERRRHARRDTSREPSTIPTRSATASCWA